MGFAYHDNEIDLALADNYQLVGGSYTVDDFSISPGQDPDHHIYAGLTVPLNVTTGAMIFSVGRHKTSSVGDWFKQQITANQNTQNECFDTLNFAFIGTLNLTLTGSAFGTNHVPVAFDDIVLAQGNKDMHNIWFFGGKQCQYIGNNTVACSGIAHYGFGASMNVQHLGSAAYKFAMSRFVFESGAKAATRPRPANASEF